MVSRNGEGSSVFIMYLDPAKVVKRFGAHPEKGVFLPGVLKRVTVGMKWSLPKRDYVPDDDVMVQPCITLVCVGKGKWRVSVERAYKQKAVNYLMDNCM